MLNRTSHSISAKTKFQIFWLQDQDDLDEAREISAFNRLRHSGEVKFLEEELRNDLHTMEACVPVVFAMDIKTSRRS